MSYFFAQAGGSALQLDHTDNDWPGLICALEYRVLLTQDGEQLSKAISREIANSDARKIDHSNDAQWIADKNGQGSPVRP